ncbi:MAG: vWA domain-containing protein [Acidobacteriota bacterium]
MGSRLRSTELRRKGMAIIVTALMLVFVIPVVGLAIDAAVLYTIKARLQTAVDAGAIAAARTLNKGLTIGEQAGNAQAKATAYFYANYPEGELGATQVTIPTPDVSESGYRRRTVAVTGSVMAPTYFMRVFGYTRTKVQANGTATRRDVNIIMVLDRSGSMSTSGSCQPMKDAAKQFVGLFANGRDRIGMITYSTGYFQAFPHTMDFLTTTPNINTKIDSITCTGYTNTSTAVSEAYTHISTINEPGVLNIILLFTDGLPTAATASYPVKRKQDNRYGYFDGNAQTRPIGNDSGREDWGGTGTSYTNIPPSPCTTTVGSVTHSWYKASNSSTTYLQASPNPSWTPANLTGVLLGGSGSNTGTTSGLYKPLATSITATDGGMITGISGCRMGTNANYVRRDIAYIPAADTYGNSMRGLVSTDDFGSGNYNGQIRPDKPISLAKAFKNATYNAAIRIRGDTRLQPVFYIIALGNPTDPDPYSQPDTDLMLRMSNDPTSPEYVSTQTDGMFVFAPDNSQLNAAFVRVASEILRIAN